MNGTIKQIAWASDIINTAAEQLALCERNIDRYEAQRTGEGESLAGYTKRDIETLREILVKMSVSADASWVIRNREGLTAENVVRKLRDMYRNNKIRKIEEV